MEIKEEIIEEIQILDDQADLNKVFINWIKLAQLIFFFYEKDWRP